MQKNTISQSILDLVDKRASRKGKEKKRASLGMFHYMIKILPSRYSGNAIACRQLASRDKLG
jgi:hypothetical protein